MFKDKYTYQDWLEENTENNWKKYSLRDGVYGFNDEDGEYIRIDVPRYFPIHESKKELLEEWEEKEFWYAVPYGQDVIYLFDFRPEDISERSQGRFSYGAMSIIDVQKEFDKILLLWQND